jgi:hypothetical protein
MDAATLYMIVTFQDGSMRTFVIREDSEVPRVAPGEQGKLGGCFSAASQLQVIFRCARVTISGRIALSTGLCARWRGSRTPL